MEIPQITGTNDNNWSGPGKSELKRLRKPVQGLCKFEQVKFKTFKDFLRLCGNPADSELQWLLEEHYILFGRHLFCEFTRCKQFVSRNLDL